MSNENLSTFRKFVMEYGSILGLCWTAYFACYVIGFRTQSGLFHAFRNMRTHRPAPP